MKQDGTARFGVDLSGDRVLPFVLSVIAGSADVTGFLGLGALAALKWSGWLCP
jgi:hypothetical protein